MANDNCKCTGTRFFSYIVNINVNRRRVANGNNVNEI